MALTQIQIMQSLGEAMAWFERELQWGVPPGELRHLTGRIGELYAALITNGQMAIGVNKKGYDVVGVLGEYISVKTTSMMGFDGHSSFNLNTLDKVDRVLILRINKEEMQIDTLLNTTTEEARKLMSKPDANGKVSLAHSKLIGTPKKRSDILTINTATYEAYRIRELETGKIEVEVNGEKISPDQPVLPVLREIAAKLNIGLLNSNGNPHNTRQLGSLLIRTINSESEDNT